LSEAAVSYDFEQLVPSEPPSREAPVRALAEAESEAHALREQARSEGYAAGLEVGREEGAAQMRSATAALGEALAGVAELREQTAEAVEADAVELALALAGKILAATCELRPEVVLDVVQGALRRVAGQRTVAILLNPADLDLLRQALTDESSAVGQQLGALEGLDLQAEERVGRGGAVVRTADGVVDASIATQLERAREVAMAELGGGGDQSAA
jgi:flagellar assembly protein FliH